MYNKLKQHKHRQLNKPQQQPLNNNNIMNNYKDNDKLKQNNVYNKKLKGCKSSVKSFLIYRIIIHLLETRH